MLSAPVIITLVLLLAAMLFFTFDYIKNSDKVKRLNFVLEEEVRHFNLIGLDSAINKNGYSKSVFFHHPKYMLETKYNFNMGATRNIQDTFMPLDSVININQKELKNILKSINKNAITFIKENNLEDYKLSYLVPLIFILDFNVEALKLAIDSQVHPAILASIAEKNDIISVLQTTDGLKDMPIEWLSEIYDFKYSEKNIVWERYNG